MGRSPDLRGGIDGMKHTHNFGFKKPEPTDTVNVNDFNDSFDLVDQKLKETQDKNTYLDETFKHLTIDAGSNNAEIVAAHHDRVTGKTYDWIPDRLDDQSSQLAQIENQKASKTELQQVSLSYKESYATLVDLQTAYPSGDAHNHAVLDDGMIYTWNSALSTPDWVSTNIQANGTGVADGTVTYGSLNDLDTFTAHAKWDELINNSDSTGIWTVLYTYKAGYVRTIKVRINGAVDQSGYLYIYRDNGDGTYTRMLTFDISGHGDVIVTLNRFINYDFIVATKCANVGFKNISSSLYYGGAISSSNTVTPSITTKYMFTVSVSYNATKRALERLEKIVNNKNGISPCKIIPRYPTTQYPIVFDFENKKLTTELYIVQDAYSRDNNITYNEKVSEIAIPDFPAEGYYVIYLLADTTSYNLSIFISNGVTLINNTLGDFDSKVCLAYGLTNGQTYFTIGSINANYIKAILKTSLNTDVTTDDDKVIPKYGEKLVITRDILMNKWFGKTVNCIGDSVFKGEDSANSYLRMKDDNVASILKEEFGFATARNYGIGGCTISNRSTTSLINRYTSMADADLNIIEGGTNDFALSVLLGTTSDLSDNTKFKPALYNLINGMQSKYPGKQMLVITPTHRNDAKPDTVANSAGLYLKDYRDAMIEVCEILGVKYLDMWSELGFTPFNATMRAAYMPDGLHPSILGMRTYYAKRICDIVRSL